MFDQYGRFIPTSMQAQQIQPAAQRAILPNGPPDGGRQQLGGMQQAQPLQFGPQIQSIGAQFSQSPSAMVRNSAFQNQPSTQIQRTQAQNTPNFQMQPQNVNTLIKTGQIPQGPQQGIYQPMTPQQSVIQSVNNNDPQSVQNFLQALKQVGAGGNNTFMHNAGNQGQQAQAGFTGFGNTQAPQALGYYGPTGYGGGINGQMGAVNNGAYMNSNGQMANQAQAGQFQAGGPMQQGGTGGVAGQPGTGASGQPGFYTPDYTRNDTPVTYGANAYNDYYNQQSQDVQWQMGGQSQGQQNAPFTDPYPTGTKIQQDYWTKASDENAKTNIKSADAELNDFLSNLGAYEYEYKDPKYGEGTHVSPMAQEIEKSELGAKAIHTNNEGYKMVNYATLAPITLASVAYLHKKVNDLAKQIGESTLQNLSKRGK